VRQGRRRKAKKGSLFGKTPDRRKSALWAAGCAAAAVLFAILVQIPRSGVEPEAAYRLELWEPVGVLATLALYFGTTALVLWLPEQRRPAAQVALAAATALLLLTVTALPAERLPSPASLTYDEWPLAIALCVFALPVAFFGLNRELPVRLFILGAAVPFILILPDYVGLYIELTGEFHPMIGRTVVAVPESVWVYATAENAAERRASGVFVTWYALLLAATWAPMLYVLLRRRRALRDSPA
jgi:hypothetical protein